MALGTVLYVANGGMCQWCAIRAQTNRTHIPTQTPNEIIKHNYFYNILLTIGIVWPTNTISFWNMWILYTYLLLWECFWWLMPWHCMHLYGVRSRPTIFSSFPPCHRAHRSTTTRDVFKMGKCAELRTAHKFYYELWSVVACCSHGL